MENCNKRCENYAYKIATQVKSFGLHGVNFNIKIETPLQSYENPIAKPSNFPHLKNIETITKFTGIFLPNLEISHRVEPIFLGLWGLPKTRIETFDQMTGTKIQFFEPTRIFLFS